MATENTKWNKKIFAMLLERAKGVRSWRQFAIDCGVSYVQLRKLALLKQENPPRPKLICHIASNAFGDIDIEDFMFAAGRSVSESAAFREREATYEKYRSLSAADKKTASLFIDFLVSNGEKQR